MGRRKGSGVKVYKYACVKCDNRFVHRGELVELKVDKRKVLVCKDCFYDKYVFVG